MGSHHLPRPDDPDADWVTAWTVWHVHAKRYIVRHDGKPFRFRKRR